MALLPYCSNVYNLEIENRPARVSLLPRVRVGAPYFPKVYINGYGTVHFVFTHPGIVAERLVYKEWQ